MLGSCTVCWLHANLDEVRVLTNDDNVVICSAK